MSDTTVTDENNTTNSTKESQSNKQGAAATEEPGAAATEESAAQYAVLMETSGSECESWYYFIRKNGNEDALRHLQQQLEQVDWYVVDDLSTFDLDLSYFVTTETAKQMTKIDVNSFAFHRKFDGKLRTVNLRLHKKHNNEKKMCKVFNKLGYGQIENFIGHEDLDDSDLTSHSSSGDESSSDSSSGDSSSGASSSGDESKQAGDKQKTGIPPALLTSERPPWTRHKCTRKKTKKKKKWA